MTSTENQLTPWGAFALHGWRAAWVRSLHALPAGKFWRRIALWLRKPVKNALGEIVDTEVWGLKLRLHVRDNLSEQRLLFMPQFLDAVERTCLASELKAGGCFLDIGANAGVYSLWVASACGKGVRVEAFEPDPELCERLHFNLATNQFSHVHLNPVALGRQEGDVHLKDGWGNKGENCIQASDSTGTAVRMTTLPTFLNRAGISRVDALKIDVEGHEADVLEPLFQQVPPSVWPRLLVCELVHDASHRLNQLLSVRGYQLIACGRLNGIYRFTDDIQKPTGAQVLPCGKNEIA
jgi:FkbM family methyltransferase